MSASLPELTECGRVTGCCSQPVTLAVGVRVAARCGDIAWAGWWPRPATVRVSTDSNPGRWNAATHRTGHHGRMCAAGAWIRGFAIAGSSGTRLAAASRSRPALALDHSERYSLHPGAAAGATPV